MEVERMERVIPSSAAAATLEVNGPVRRILCAVGPGDADVLRTATALGKRWGAQVYALHVLQDVHEGVLASGFIQDVPLSEAKGLDLLERLKMQAGDGEGPVEAESIVRTGPLRKTIDKEAKLLKADVLITGHRHEAGVPTPARKAFFRWDWVLSALGFDPVSAGW
jgi:nucleotide-binding universal stress UspA family protein